MELEEVVEQLRAITVRAHQPVSIKVAMKEVWEVLRCPEMTELALLREKPGTLFTQLPRIGAMV